MEKLSIAENIAAAKTLSTSFYKDPRCFEAAKELIFEQCWHFIGDVNLVNEPGMCFPFTLLEGFLDEPLLLTRDANNQLHCLSNVCTHRGNLLITEPCKTGNLRCKYHGRLFDLDGTFRAMPEFKDVQNFPTTDDNLHRLPLFNWGPLLFTSLNSTLKADTFFKEVIERVGWMPLEHFIFYPELSKEYTVQAHWALYCENYLEGFHIPFVHAGLNTVIDYGSYTTDLFSFSNLQLGMAKDDEACFDLPPASPDYGKRVAAYYFWIYPNLMLNFYPWGLSVNVVQPITINETKVCFYSYVWKADKLNSGAGAGLDKVEQEDEAIVQNVQKGIRSRFYKHGRYSPTREQGTHHFHRLLAEGMSK
jgi:choline monooxygenase